MGDGSPLISFFGADSSQMMYNTLLDVGTSSFVSSKLSISLARTINGYNPLSVLSHADIFKSTAEDCRAGLMSQCGPSAAPTNSPSSSPTETPTNQPSKVPSFPP